MSSTKKVDTDKIQLYQDNKLKTDSYKVIDNIIDNLDSYTVFESTTFDDRYDYLISGSKKLKQLYISKLNKVTGGVIYSVRFINAKNLFDLVWNNSILNTTHLIRGKVQLRFVKSFFESFTKKKKVNEAADFNRWYIPFLTISFIHDTYSDIGYLSLMFKEDGLEIDKIEVRGLGLSKDKKYDLFKFSFPQEMSNNTEFLDDFEFFLKDIAEIFNKNVLGYHLSFDLVVKDKVLNPYGVLKSDKKMSLAEMEKVFYSLKEVNYKIKDYWMKNLRKIKK